jgi:hypothetical protein
VWTVAVKYQVLYNGQNISGLTSLASAGISVITESVTVTSGNPLWANGKWCSNTATVCSPGQLGSLNAQGTFWDLLSGFAMANQSFLIGGQKVLIGIPGLTGASTVLNNNYNSPKSTVSITYGGHPPVTFGAGLRQCGSEAGAPAP